MPIPNDWPDYWSNKNFPGILGEFIQPGALVFDIGANIGKMTWAYRCLNARVIAVEPQAACAAQLRATFIDDDQVEVIEVACGSEAGTAEMACYGGTTISTLVPDHYWQQGGPWANTPKDWTETVKIVTLDSLIARYGVPSFIKIDVEGYEHQVLCGLSQLVPLSFEFHPYFWKQACACMARILEIEPQAEFCNVLGESLVPIGWCGYDEMTDRIMRLLAEHGTVYFGNMYARKATYERL